MRDAQRAERVAVAQRLLAAGRLCQQRIAVSGEDRTQWCIDNWEAVAAEVGAELGISRGRASSQMHYGLTLLERFPKLAAVFAAGDVDFRVIAAIDFRTGLITDTAVLAHLDETLARKAPKWNKLSREKVSELIDWMVVDLDPEAVRAARQREANRYIEVEPDENGMADIWGHVRAPDAFAFDQRLNNLAATVCKDDQRTKRQRRADALAPLTAGQATMECTCGSADCPAADTETTTSPVVIHVLAEEATVSDDGTKPGFLPDYGSLPAKTVRDLATRAKLRPVVHPKEAPAERRYRPSAALADFIRCRDLTCRFPSCDQPAVCCDIDHTVPYPFGPTQASNLKCLCRLHHLLKTFWTGSTGWRDRQLPDGTVIWTSPSGRTYTTKPHGTLLFPQLGIPTAELVLPDAHAPPDRSRELAMPLRQHTRAHDRAYRVEYERGLNRARYAADPPPF